MRQYIQPMLLSALLAATLCWSPAVAAGTAGPDLRLEAARIPFIENAGQWRDEARFCAPLFTGAFFVAADGGMVYLLEGKDKKGAREALVIEENILMTGPLSVAGAGKMPGTASYFAGGDRTRWASELPMYNSVTFGEVYASIEFDLYASGTNVEKRFTVAPGGDPRDIRVGIEADGGLAVAETGELVLSTGAGDITFTGPVAFQDIGGRREYVDIAYVVDGKEYGFEVGAFSRDHALIIDPLLAGT